MHLYKRFQCKINCEAYYGLKNMRSLQIRAVLSQNSFPEGYEGFQWEESRAERARQ